MLKGQQQRHSKPPRETYGILQSTPAQRHLQRDSERKGEDNVFYNRHKLKVLLIQTKQLGDLDKLSHTQLFRPQSQQGFGDIL